MINNISEKEFAVIEALSSNHSYSQRLIAKKIGISLGLTNLIINRLAQTGYIKVKQLNRHKIQYILTPKGFSEKAKKSYNYTLRTINVLSSVVTKIQSLIIEKYKSGIRNFIIVGDNELADLTEIAIKKIKITDIRYSRELTNGKVSAGETFLFYNTKSKTNGNYTNLILFLSETGINA
ncbi:MAG: hypothetical protein A2474_07155 [Elusimicrobia bacterium RIFOXYC2_FULL_34_12]|nr:MAG: hypothetical protein A2474_07155 [Elusimicrobia bacterium RIFOXYC2_FULL_34_12]